jgi:hypothetical protein
MGSQRRRVLEKVIGLPPEEGAVECMVPGAERSLQFGEARPSPSFAS